MEIDQIIQGDALEVLKSFPDNSIDAVITDPPYGLSNHSPEEVTKILREWLMGNDVFVPNKKGFMGKSWDAFVPPPAIWKEVFRVMKPGAHLLCFAETRTADLMGISLRFAGFEIRDTIEWIYGSGFPKSLNIGKAVDKIQGNERKVTGEENRAKPTYYSQNVGGKICKIDNITITKGTSEWEGWGTALKPAHEPIILARKPLSEPTVAENCLKWGTGGLNIDGSRVETTDNLDGGGTIDKSEYKTVTLSSIPIRGRKGEEIGGRFPANLIHDGSDEVKECFPETNNKGHVPKLGKGNPFGGNNNNPREELYFNDSGSASRFFKSCPFEEEDFKSIIYEEKADKKDRNEGIKNGNLHPTVKPIVLMCYLMNMITRPNQIVLDPFIGSGTTAVACKKLYRHYIGIEISPEYYEIARKRVESFQVLDFEEQPYEE